MNSIQYTKLLNEFRKLNAKLNGIVKQVRRMRYVLEGADVNSKGELKQLYLEDNEDSISKTSITRVDDLKKFVTDNNLADIKYTKATGSATDVRKNGTIYNK